MIGRSMILMAVIILAAGVVSACSSDDNAATPGMRAVGTIQGRVIDLAADEPLAGVKVEILSKPFVTDLTGTGEIVIYTTTDVNGMFLRNDVANGSVTVWVSRDGYRTPDPKNWALSAGGTGEFRFEMAPGEDPVPEFEGDEQNARPPDWSEGK